MPLTLRTVRSRRIERHKDIRNRMDGRRPEDGDIIFYAAGNAANRNNSNTGDRIYTTQNRVQPDSACGVSERPILTRIVDSASGNLRAHPNSTPDAPRAKFATGTSREAHGGYIREGKYPTELNCVGVEIAGQRVPILYVQGDQINVQAPTLTQWAQCRYESS